ncbi:hypothetical protein cypCar_00001440 [Cyprinus carpio]|nr:hypothetical protein cypCar_00001440 [Cyprinus carpio]
MDTEADLFYRLLPKVELHAHLNGSVSSETMETLIKRKPHLNIEHSMTAIRRGQRRSLDECVTHTHTHHINTLECMDG